MNASARVTSKGQVTIPEEIRERFAIAPGDELVFIPGPDGDLAVRVRRPRIGAGRGIMARHATSLGGRSLAQLRDDVGAAVSDGVADKGNRGADDAD